MTLDTADMLQRFWPPWGLSKNGAKTTFEIKGANTQKQRTETFLENKLRLAKKIEIKIQNNANEKF